MAGSVSIEPPSSSYSQAEKINGATMVCPAAPHAGQALRVVEGECKATEYLARLHAEQAAPDELALIVSMLDGATLRGFCRVIEKALGVRHA